MRQRLPNRRRLPQLLLRLAVAIAFVIPLAGAVPAAADWPMFRGDAMRSGLAPEFTARSLEAVWAAELGGSVDSSPAVADGKAYVGNSLGTMSAVSADSGEVVWAFQTDGAIVSSPAVASGIVLFGSVDRFFYALDAESGDLIWSYRTRGPILSSPAVADGMVLFGSMDGRLYAVSLGDGSLLWRTAAGPGIQGAPAVSGQLVFYGNDHAAMRALNLADGSLAWEQQGRGRMIAAPVVRDDVVVFGLMGPSALRPPRLDYLIAFEAATGRQIWAQNEAFSVLSSPLISEDRVFFVTVEGYVSKTVARAARLSDGELLWDRTLAGVVDSSAVLLGQPDGDAGALLCFGCHDGRLYLLDAGTGAVVGFSALATKIYSSPAVSGDRIYVGANDGRLHCLQ